MIFERVKTKKRAIIICIFIYVDLRNQHRLILVLDQHVLVSSIDNSEHVRWHLRWSLATVHFDNFIRVDGQSTVGVDSHTEKT